MSTIINATTTNGVVIQPDNSGSLVLQSNGTTKFNVDSTGAYGQLQSGTAVASTSGTSIDYTSIPSWVKRITVMLNGVSVSGIAHFLIQIGTGGTPTTSGYVSTSTYVLAGSSQTGGVSSSAGFIMFFSNSTYVSSGHFTLTNVSGNIWVCSGITSNFITVPYTGQTGGNVTLGGTLNMLRITTSNGTDTFDAGSVNILYE
jgi:hypothetical protein